MNFLGEEAISRPTRATGRALLIFAFTLVIQKLGWIEVADTSVVGLRFAEDRLEVVLSILTAALTIAHIVQWNGDRLSYSAWNIEGRRLGGPRWDAPSKTHLSGLVYDLDSQLRDAGEENGHNLDITKLLQELRLLNQRVTSFRDYSFFFVYVWHMIVPVGAALIALCWGTLSTS
ncbi:MAG: hypothetical protein AAGF30_14295 [Pseudomonadota bacterium]